jgi:hypothetical protein
MSTVRVRPGTLQEKPSETRFRWVSLFSADINKLPINTTSLKKTAAKLQKYGYNTN